MIVEAREKIQFEGLKAEEAQRVLYKARWQSFQEHYGETPEFVYDVFGWRVGPFLGNGIVPNHLVEHVKPSEMERDAYWAITGKDFVLLPRNGV